MARKKNYFDFNDFNSVDGALDLFNNTIRRAFDYDALTDDVFDAILLTDPTPMVEDIQSLKVEAAYREKVLYSFRVRILGPNSPHKFLENPCEIDFATTPIAADQIFSMIQNHTQVVTELPSGEHPAAFDIIKVKLEKSGNAFNTQRAKAYLGLLNKAEAGSGRALKREACQSLIDFFDTVSVADLASYTPAARVPIDPAMRAKALAILRKFKDDVTLFFPLKNKSTSMTSGAYRAGGAPHGANDLGSKDGTPLYAPMPGRIAVTKVTVRFDPEAATLKLAKTKCPTKITPAHQAKIDAAGKPGTNSCGNTITFFSDAVDGDRIMMTFCHMQKIVGGSRAVKAGELIGYTGGTPGALGAGNTSNEHLHYDLSLQGGRGSPERNLKFDQSLYNEYTSLSDVVTATDPSLKPLVGAPFKFLAGSSAADRFCDSGTLS